MHFILTFNVIDELEITLAIYIANNSQKYIIMHRLKV